jgi:imidazoleglycerol-phosphate dehydratase
MIRLARKTRETDITLTLALTPGDSRIHTDDAFLSHMLATLVRYAGVTLTLDATGDLKHHLIEDTAIVLGEAVRRAAPEARVRYGHAVVPMDDALVEAALDLGDRPFANTPVPSSLYAHWFRSFATEARATLHVRVLRGTDRHHVIEGAFKALGFALRQACAASDGVQSTKGRVDWNDSAPTEVR